MRRYDFPLRSLMFVPGHVQRHITKASKSIADAIILDVEDSVMPISNKEIARQLIGENVASGLFKNTRVFVRINDRESGHCLKDVYSLMIEGVDGFVYPKAIQGGDIFFFDKLLETIEYEKKFPIGTFKIIPLIETAAAVLNAMQICLSSDRVVAIAYGCEDYIADIEGVHDPDGKSLFVPRSLIAMAARATGVIPIDTVHINVADFKDLRKNAELARILGFEGMLILHEKEIKIAHEVFSPSDEEVGDAREMLRLSKMAEEMDKGVAIMNGKFIGPPMVQKANRVLGQHNRIQRKKLNQ